MGRYLPIIIIALLMIYCVVEVAQAPPLQSAGCLAGCGRRRSSVSRWLALFAGCCSVDPTQSRWAPSRNQSRRHPTTTLISYVGSESALDLVRALDSRPQTVSCSAAADIAEVVVSQSLQLFQASDS
jgi:hypothetical protein